MDDLTPKVEPLSASFPEPQTEIPATARKSKKAKAHAAAVGHRNLPDFTAEDTEDHILDTLA